MYRATAKALAVLAAGLVALALACFFALPQLIKLGPRHDLNVPWVGVWSFVAAFYAYCGHMYCDNKSKAREAPGFDRLCFSMAVLLGALIFVGAVAWYLMPDIAR